MVFKEYKLSATLKGHDLDVKDVAAFGDEIIVSVSRDGKVLIWKKELDGSWSSFLALKLDVFVNAVAMVDETEGQFVASAGQDAIINLTNLGKALVYPASGNLFDEPHFLLAGHEKNVCSLASFGNGDSSLMISGSWDTHAIVWENHVEKYKLVGHRAAVWDAQFVSGTQYLTASADQTVKLWEGAKLIKTFTGIHQDVIRSLVVLDQNTFISASNDGIISIVDIPSGKVVKRLAGHTSFIYKIKLLDELTLVSCGEDKIIKIWDLKTGRPLQTLYVPSISVWSLAVLKNKDIAVGGSDAAVRVFSADPQRIDDVAHSQLLEETLSQAVNPQALDESKLSGPEALETPGNKEGKTIIVKSPTGIVEAYLWSNNHWQKIGEVLGAAGNSQVSTGNKVEYMGKNYDFVFDVDVKDNAPPLKLPYNLNDNVYAVAEKFLADNDLPTSYKQQVVDFIMQNTQGVQLGQPAGSTYDPYADRNPSDQNGSFTTFESFKKQLFINGIEAYNAKVDLSAKLSRSDLNEIDTLLDNVNSSSNAAKLYEYAGPLADKGELVGYDLLRVIIKQLPFDDELEALLLKGLALLSRDQVANTDVAKLVVIGRCFCNLLANNANNEKKVTKNLVLQSQLNDFYKTKVENNSNVKDTVKAKFFATIEALKNNLLLL